MKKILSVLILTGVVITVTQTRAANLNQAVSALPQNDEWALMARSSLGQNSGSSFLRAGLNGGSATDYEKRILAITAQGQNPRTWGQENFVASLLSRFDGTQIGDSVLLNDDIFGLLALRSAGESGNTINKLRDHILKNQNPDGGWSFSRGGSSDSNTTAMAAAALKTSGSVPDNAIAFLKNTQNGDGGFGYTTSASSDGASTAWAIIGLRSAGSTVEGNAIAYLESLQTAGGGFKWRPSDANSSSLVTSYAVIALAGKTIPIRTVSNASPTPRAPTPVPPAPSVPIPKPAPAPAPNPAPAVHPAPPAPAPTPALSPTPVSATTSSASIISTSTFTPVSTTDYKVTIKYPDNTIYVDQMNLYYTFFRTSNGSNFYYSNPRAIATLVKAASDINLLYEIESLSGGVFVKTINGYAPSGGNGWIYAVNGTTPNIPASDYILKPGDKIQWFYGNSNTAPY